MNKEIIKSNNNTLRKVKNFPSATSIWNNSIYSFNQNYLKNIPAVDNIVNKLIKSFFSINPLANNPKGKKSKLIQRRYKKLSLNKILVSKSEIKHNNDKVFITVYLFNKKKKSLLLKLKNLGQTLALTPKTLTGENINKDFGYTNENNELNNIQSNLLNSNSLYNTLQGNNSNTNVLDSKKDKYNVPGFKATNTGVYESKYKTLNYKLKLGLASKEKTNQNHLGGDKDLFNSITLNKYVSIKGLNTNHNNSYAVSYLNSGVSNTMLNNKFFDKSAQSIFIPGETNLEVNSYSKDNNSRTDFLNGVRYYKNLNLITKHNVHMFISSFIGNTSTSNNNVVANKPLNVLDITLGNNASKNIDLKDYFRSINKYKLYNNTVSYTASDLSLTKNNVTAFSYLGIDKAVLSKPNYSVYKLKSINKLFALYNNINLGLVNNMNYTKTMTNTYSNKVLLNTYKLLRKSYTVLSTNLSGNVQSNGVYNTKNYDLPLNVYNIAHMSRNKGLRTNNYSIKGLEASHSNNKSYTNLKRSMRNIILINKLNRIDRFFDKYKKAFLLNMNQTDSNSLSLQHIINNYKVNFINELMEKELLYVYYLKLLSYNDIVFKNWFIYSLKNLISKIYNKKVIFNLVNLKYIHLNSDILSQAVNIRLRNFKKNRVVKVLKKVIKLVPISKVNIYACDEHSSIYKYVNGYHNKFRNLKLDIFKELGLDTSDNKTTQGFCHKGQENQGPRSYGILRKLDHTQANTINFIKYKSVFGVRLEAAGRLTKRSTASRSIFKYRYNGTLRNNAIINNNISSVIVKDNRISNLQFTQISSKTRNGSFGLKGWINNN